MKIKFEIKSAETSSYPLYTVFMEHKGKDSVELFMTKYNFRQLKMGESQTIETQDIPINDGKITMNRDNLKEFIEALKLLSKSFKKKV